MINKGRLKSVLIDIESGAMLWEQSAYPYSHRDVMFVGTCEFGSPSKLRGCFIGWGAYLNKDSKQDYAMFRGADYFGLSPDQTEYLSNSRRTWEEIRGYVNSLIEE